MSVRILLLFLLVITGVQAAPPVQLGRTSYGNQNFSSGSSSAASLTSASTVGGSPTQIQYNLNGGFAGISGSAVDTNGLVNLGNSTSTPSATLQLSATPTTNKFLQGNVPNGGVGWFFSHNSNFPIFQLNNSANTAVLKVGGNVAGFSQMNLAIGSTATAGRTLEVFGTGISTTIISSTVAMETPVLNGPSGGSLSMGIQGAGAKLYVGINGNVGVKTGVSPATDLEVLGKTSTTTLQVASAVTLTSLPTGTASSNLCIMNNGGVISSTTLSGCLGVSDPALKKDIRPLAYGLAEVLATDAVMYKDIRPGAFPGEQVGFLAYSVDRNSQRYRGLEAVMPELVDPKATFYNGKYYKGVIYERAIVVAFKAIQEVSSRENKRDALFLTWLILLTLLVFWRRKNEQ